MTSTIDQPETRLDWYEEICQRLDALNRGAYEYADEGEVLPPSGLYEFAKQTVSDLRQLAGFPNLSTPDVWLGPDGQIGLTWEAGNRSLELIVSGKRVLARLTIDSKQTVLEPMIVPFELKKIAS
ncbi:MAG: hypothetical protein WC028_15600 [Candidatus Obscuribacterales bacterium]